MRKLDIVAENAIGVLKLWHGTSDINAKKIKSQGLRSEVDSPKWYLLSSHKDDAIFHSEKVMGNPVIMEFEVPHEDIKRKWKGFPYLWKPYKAGGGFKGEWYAIRKVLPPKFIKKIIKVKREDLKRVKEESRK